MSMVMLNADLRQRMIQSPAGTEIVRMEIVPEDLGIGAIDPREIAERFLEKSVRFEVLKIANVLAENGVMALGETEGVFQFGADAQCFLEFHAEIDGFRRVAASPADHARGALVTARYGVV